MDLLIIFLLSIVIIFNIIILVKVLTILSNHSASKQNENYDDLREDILTVQTNIINSQSELFKAYSAYTKDILKEMNETLINRLNENNKSTVDLLSTNYEHYNRLLNNSFVTINNSLTTHNKNMTSLLENNLSAIAKALFSQLKSEREFNTEILTNNSNTLNNGIIALTQTTDSKLNVLINSINESFVEIRKDLNTQINNIRQTVNERLDKTINEQFDKSFRNVLAQMNDLQKSMGELKSISNQVGSLEKTLNGVKTRGILGEVQLKGIIADVLTPNQYDIEVPTKRGSNDHVEIAIKLPEKDGDGYIYLPIDSKCHLDRYEELMNAYSTGNADSIKIAKKRFADAIKSDAHTICEKYISIPDTTPYAVLFVPFEGMYSEIVNLNILDELNKYHITVAGPYTLMAILSTVTNYFQALAIEKKSHDIERTLGKVKYEFNKYNDVLSKVRKNLDAATSSLTHLQETRTRAMTRALNNITEISSAPTIETDEFPTLIPPDEFDWE